MRIGANKLTGLRVDMDAQSQWTTWKLERTIRMLIAKIETEELIRAESIEADFRAISGRATLADCIGGRDSIRIVKR